MRAAGKAPAENAFAAVNACQEHMLNAARAHTDRVVLEAFIEGIEETRDPYIRSILNQVCDLFALATLEEHRAWYMEHDRFDGNRSREISQAVDDLIVELRPVVLELVGGLGVPEGWLNSAMLADAGGQRQPAEQGTSPVEQGTAPVEQVETKVAS